MSLPPPPIQAWGTMPSVWRRWFQTVFAKGAVPNATVTTAKIADGAVTAAKLATDAVETAKIKDANVTGAKLATSAADATTVEVASGSMRVKDAGVTTAKLADGAVTGPKLGIPGLVFAFAGSVAPTGTLLCDGSAVSRTTYAALFAAIGTTWGVGDGSTTFNLPDLRGRAPIGAGQGSGLTNRTLGGTGGAETHTLTAAESGAPAHSHPFGGGANDFKQSQGFASGSDQYCPATGAVANAGNTGNSTAADASSAHANMQPWAAVTWIITT